MTSINIGALSSGIKTCKEIIAESWQHFNSAPEAFESFMSPKSHRRFSPCERQGSLLHRQFQSAVKRHPTDNDNFTKLENDWELNATLPAPNIMHVAVSKVHWCQFEFMASCDIAALCMWVVQNPISYQCPGRVLAMTIRKAINVDGNAEILRGRSLSGMELRSAEFSHNDSGWDAH